jgi:hypothetical protein
MKIILNGRNHRQTQFEFELPLIVDEMLASHTPTSFGTLRISPHFEPLAQSGRAFQTAITTM